VYRYRITVPNERIADFEHKSDMRLSAGFIVDEPGRPRLRVTRIVQQAKVLLGMEIPLLSKVGVAEAEPYTEQPASR
jgi:hypothetical protein